MTANEARAQIVELLGQQHLVGQMTHAGDKAKYISNAIEILRLAKTADLSPEWKAPTPPPVREVLDNPEKLAIARHHRSAMAQRRAALMAKPQHLRSAAEDYEIERIKGELVTLDREIEIASLMEGADA
jgi:hypothetical protein